MCGEYSNHLLARRRFSILEWENVELEPELRRNAIKTLQAYINKNTYTHMNKYMQTQI